MNQNTKFTPDFSRWIFQIPLSDVQTTDEDTSISNCCMLCGKAIKGDAKYMVHLLTSGHLISSDQDFDNSQGFFPVGTECRKRLPNNFIFKV